MGNTIAHCTSGCTEGSSNLLASLGNKPIVLADAAGTASDAPSTVELAFAEQKQDEAARAAAWKATLEEKFGSDASIVKLEDGTLVAVNKDNEPLGIVTVKNGEVSLNGFDDSKSTVDATANVRIEQLVVPDPVKQAPDQVSTNADDDADADDSIVTDAGSGGYVDDSENSSNTATNTPVAGANTTSPATNNISNTPAVTAPDPTLPVISDDGYDPIDYVDTRDPTDVHSVDAVNGSDLASDQTRANIDANNAAGALGMVNTLIGLKDWDNASDFSHVQTVVGLYNQVNSFANLDMPNMGGIGAGLGFINAVQNGDFGGMVVSGVSLGNALFEGAVSEAIGAALGMNAVNVIPGLNLIIALTNIEENPFLDNIYYLFNSTLDNIYPDYSQINLEKSTYLLKNAQNDDLFTLAA